MLLTIDNPVYNTVIVFSIIMLLLYITKPDVIYDNEKKEFRQFGTTDGKTLLPIYVIGILLAIVLYVFFHYVSQKNITKDNPKKRSFSSVMMLFEPEADYGVKKPNLSAEIIDSLSKPFKKTPSPEDIFYYIYAVLYSEIYRTKYAEFLKIDFPRVPFTKDYKLFKKMTECGNWLVDLHLLKSPELDSPIARFQGKGDNKVEKIKYGQGKVYLNNDQYFEGILSEVWQYQIGGYQVCDKWLKDRKGRILSLDDIRHYCKVVTAIKKTIEIQKKIDNLYPEIEKGTIEFRNEKE